MPRPRALIYLAPVVVIAGLLALRAAITPAQLDRLATAPSLATDPRGTTAYTGSIFVARGGPIFLGFLGDHSRVELDGVEIHKAISKPWDCPPPKEGLVVCRILADAGPHALRFAAAPGARLMWSPVGRRGDPVYVMPSSLSPEPPDSAEFTAPDTATGDGVIALAILFVVIATLAYAARARLALVPRDTWIAMGAVLGLAVIVRWIDLEGFGQTWDEDTNWSAGRNYITNLLSLDFADRSWRSNFEHPPVMKYLAGIGAQFSTGFGPARALSAIWVSLGCALMVPIGKRLFRLRVGVLAGGIAALLPPLVAHGQIVGHESPTVLWWALGILLALTAHDGVTSPRQLLVRLAWVGVAIGVATASRFVNGLLGLVCVVIAIASAPVELRKRTALLAFTLMPAATLATVYAIWPRLWSGPVGKLSESYAKLSGTHSREPFLGTMTDHPSFAYFLVYLVVTMPVLAFAGAVAGGVRVARTRTVTSLTLLAWLVLPLGVMASPVRQDGVRYVLPCVMALAMLSAAGWDWLAGRYFRPAAAALGVYLAVTLALTHPYYLDYFAEEVGGAETVASHKWFETAWWGEGIDRAVDYVNEHAEPGETVYRDCIEVAHLAWFRSDLWHTMVDKPTAARWIVAYQPLTHVCAIPKDARLVYTVESRGLVLAEVWQR